MNQYLTSLGKVFVSAFPKLGFFATFVSPTKFMLGLLCYTFVYKKVIIDLILLLLLYYNYYLLFYFYYIKAY